MLQKLGERNHSSKSLQINHLNIWHQRCLCSQSKEEINWSRPITQSKLYKTEQSNGMVKISKIHKVKALKPWDNKKH